MINCPIYIPTYQRPVVVTYEELPDRLKNRCFLVIAKKQRPFLEKKYPFARLQHCPVQGQGAAKVKQWIYERCTTQVCIILDDDLKFKEANWEDGKKRFRKANEDQLLNAFASLQDQCVTSDTAFASFSTPFFNTTCDRWKENQRMVMSFFINVATCRKIGAKFSGIPTMEDVKFSMECYTAGYKSQTLMDVAVVDCSKPQSGGEWCIPGSRKVAHEAAVDYLLSRWPRFVRERIMLSAEHLATMGTQREIVFRRKAAYAYGTALRLNGPSFAQERFGRAG